MVKPKIPYSKLVELDELLREARSDESAIDDLLAFMKTRKVIRDNRRTCRAEINFGQGRMFGIEVVKQTRERIA